MRRPIKHLTPRYIFNKISRLIDERINPENPWLTPESVKILNSIIKNDDVGVEFGSGRSTKWFAKRMGFLTSIEDNQKWFSIVNDALKKENLLGSKVSYQLAKNNEEYADKANQFSDNSIDFCLVDGSVRDLCAMKMLTKIKKGGLLVIDNINWYMPNDLTHSPASKRTEDGFASSNWEFVWNEIKNWRMFWTSNGVTDTAIWIKK